MNADLNSLDVRPTRSMVTIDPSPNGYEVKVVENMGDHILAVGPRYDFKDIRCSVATHLGKNTSGVMSKKKPEYWVSIKLMLIFNYFQFSD